MQIRVWLRAAIARLSSSESPKRDAEILLAWVSGKSRAWLIAFDDAQLDDSQLAALESLLARRAAGEPVAYLIGEREFWSLPLSVSPDTLIPRPDSEVLVEQALSRLPADPCAILDLGTGTGAIALALASERPQAQVQATDASPGALAVAKRNAARHELRNVRFAEGGHDWYAPLQGARFDLIARP